MVSLDISFSQAYISILLKLSEFAYCIIKNTDCKYLFNKKKKDRSF